MIKSNSLFSHSRRSFLATAGVALAMPVLLSTAKAESGEAKKLNWDTKQVRSADGASITYRIAGRGDPLLIAHGGAGTAKEWYGVGELLAGSYTVALIERRNYGISDATGSPHSFEQEAADVAAVLKTFARSAYLLGHSAGGLVALHAARAYPSMVRRLALYEPPLTAAGPVVLPTLREMHKLIDAGNPIEALVLGYTKIVGLEPDDARKRLALKPDLREIVIPATLDVEALAALDPSPSEWSGLRMPVLLIEGEKSVSHPLRDSITALKSALPQATVHDLPGQEHVAQLLAPKLLADVLLQFFRAA